VGTGHPDHETNRTNRRRPPVTLVCQVQSPRHSAADASLRFTLPGWAAPPPLAVRHAVPHPPYTRPAPATSTPVPCSICCCLPSDSYAYLKTRHAAIHATYMLIRCCLVPPCQKFAIAIATSAARCLRHASAAHVAHIPSHPRLRRPVRRRYARAATCWPASSALLFRGPLAT